MIISESGIRFNFPDEVDVIKFDDTQFYRKYFNKLPNAKGVDFILDSSDKIVFMEVKNCCGYENENRWRLSTNNTKVETAPTTVDTSDRESLDVELPKKIAMTLTCLVGANTKKGNCQAAEELESYLKAIVDSRISRFNKTIWIILLLEGNFDSQSRTKKMIMKSLNDSIKNRLSWLNCKIDVVDSDTYRRNVLDFEII